MSGDHDRMMAAAKVIADAEGAAWEAEDFAEPWMVGLAHSHYLDIAERAVAAAAGVREAPTAVEVLAHLRADESMAGVEEWGVDGGWGVVGWCCWECLAAAIEEQGDPAAPQLSLRLVRGSDAAAPGEG